MYFRISVEQFLALLWMLASHLRRQSCNYLNKRPNWLAMLCHMLSLILFLYFASHLSNGAWCWEAQMMSLSAIVVVSDMTSLWLFRAAIVIGWSVYLWFGKIDLNPKKGLLFLQHNIWILCGKYSTHNNNIVFRVLRCCISSLHGFYWLKFSQSPDSDHPPQHKRSKKKKD